MKTINGPNIGTGKCMIDKIINLYKGIDPCLYFLTKTRINKGTKKNPKSQILNRKSQIVNPKS